MNKQQNTARLTHSGNAKANGSTTGGKPDTVARTAKAAETLAARSNPDGVDPAVKLVPGEPARALNVTDIFTAHHERTGSVKAAKMQLLQNAKQILAQAVDFEKEGAAKASEAREASDKAGVLLYQARRDGMLSSDELNAILGDQFGWKAKKDGKPSKTPNGGGEVLRKRIVRGVAASEFVASDGKEGGRLFDGVSVGDVEGIVHRLDAGELSIFTAYEAITDLKRGNTTRVDPAFNPAAIAKMVEKLAEAGSAAIIARSPGLVASYSALIDTLNIVGKEAAAIVAEAEAKAAEPLQQGAVA